MFDRFALTDEGVLFYFEPNIVLPQRYGLIRILIPYEDMQPPKRYCTYCKFPKTNLKKPMVALTFDDGPNPIYTNCILGNLIERFPTVSQRELSLNCEVACHFYDHKNFLNLSSAEITKDLKKCSRIFRRVLALEPALFRPPYGKYDHRVKDLADMPLILWSVDTRDWESHNAKSILRTVKKFGNLDGKVILMHSIHEASAKATALLIPYLLEHGYQLVTISEIIKLNYGEMPKKGKLYS